MSLRKIFLIVDYILLGCKGLFFITTNFEILFLCNNTNACQFCFLCRKNDCCLTTHAQGYMIHYQLHSQLLPKLLKKRRGNSSYFGKGVVVEFDSCEMVKEASSVILSRDFMLIQGWWQQLWYACDCCFIILAYEALKALISVTDLSSTCSARICNPCSHCVLQKFSVGCNTNHSATRIINLIETLVALKTPI